MSWEQRNADFCNAQTDAQMAYIEAEREVDRLQTENAKLREELEAAKHDLQVFSANLARLGAENAKLRELAVLNWEWAHSCCGNNCKMQTDGCGYQIDRECNYEREIYDRMRELGMSAG